MKKTVILTFLQIIFISLAFGQSAPPDDLTGNSLKTWLKDNWYTGKFQDQGYNGARTAMYSTIDKRQDGRVYGVYSGFSQESQSTTYLNPINAEHSIPQSFFNENRPMKSDIMHLFPTHQNVNSSRGNSPFDDITDSQTDTWYGTDQSGLNSSSSIPQSDIEDYSEKTSNAFEPREDHKGDVARVIFYFFTVYDLSTYGRDIEDMALGGDLAMLYEWHKNDPVDDWERTRNSRIETAQGNRNPYVDYPGLVCRAWGFDCGTSSGPVTSTGDLVITGVFDGTLTGGSPKGVELYALKGIANLGLYGLGSANNGGGTDGSEVALTGSASAGDFLYVVYEASEGDFNDFFGLNPTVTDGSATNVNGDDAFELFYDESGNFSGSEKVIDVFGDINTDGTGEAWDYVDGWAYRVAETGPNGTSFQLSEWTFGGVDALEGGTSNATATKPFPIGTFTAAVTCNAPATQISSLASTNIDNNAVGLSWTRGDGDGVIVIAKTSGETDIKPANGTAYQANATFGSGENIGSSNYVVYSGAGTSISITGLTAATSYDISAYEYKGGSCYLTDAPATLSVTTSTANDQDSEIIAPATNVAASRISALTTTREQAAEVFQFIVTDQGSGDNLPTQISKIVLTPGAANNATWSSTLAGALLINGSNTYEASLITDQAMTFEFETPLAVNDATSQTFSLSVFLNQAQVDGVKLQFEISVVHQFEVDGSGSLIIGTLPASIVSAEHEINVTASQFSFELPASGKISKDIAVSISATDINGNVDTQTRSVSISLNERNEILSSATGLSNKSLVNGVYAWTDLQISAMGSFQFSVTDNTLTTASDAISITEPSVGLLFSEYIEGTGSNKAIELFNASQNEINLSGYSIERFNNGATTPDFVLNLSDIKASLPAGEVLVIANPNADQAIRNEADATGEITFYNGDDVLALVESGEIMDLFGQIGVDPGTNWQVGASGATSEYTLIRKSSIFGGNPQPLGSFGTNDEDSEWLVLPQNSFSDIGKHTIDDNSCTPPTVGSTALALSDISENGLTLNWTRGDGQQVIVIGRAANDVSVNLSEGDIYNGDLSFGAGDEIGAGNFVLYVGDGTEAKISNLVSGTTYFFAVLEYNLNPTCYVDIGATISGNTTTTNDQDSDITAPEAQIGEISLSSLVLIEEEAIPVFTFNIVDAGTADQLSTFITKMSIVPGENNGANWHETIAGAQLTTATKTITAASISQEAISFDFTDIYEISSGSAEEFTLSIWMDSTVTDEEVLEFSIPAVHSFIANGDGSLLRTNLSAAITSAMHTIDVKATVLTLDFSTSVNGLNPFGLAVSVTDGLSNLDKAARTVSLNLSNGTGQLTSATGLANQSMTEGFFTWNDLQYDNTGEVTINVQAGELNGTAVIDVFAISNGLIFSEYIEGSSFNKALEIYNASENTVNLANYSLAIYSNGSATPSYTYNLADAKASIGSKELIVIAHTSADQSILTLATASNAEICNFNGDDAVAIIGDGQIIDIIGEIGNDPGTNWAVGSSGSTNENTLVRKPSIERGNNTALGSFGTNDATSEWIVLDTDDFSNLGKRDVPAANPSFTTITGAFDSTFGNVEVGNQSSSRSYTVQGSNLTENVSIRSTGGFLLSGNDSDFSTSLVLSPDQGALSATVFVKFAPTEAKVYTGTITHSSDDFTMIIIDVSGTGTVTEPEVSIDQSNLSGAFGEVRTGEFSDAQSLAISAQSLQGNINVIVPVGFELSENDSFESPLAGPTTYSIMPVSGAVSVTSLFVRFAPKEEGAFDDFLRVATLTKDTIDIQLSGNSFTTLTVENQELAKTAFYPNPAFDQLWFKGEAQNVEILSIDGKALFKGKVNGRKPIDVSWLEKGVYLMRIEMNGESKTSKLIIK